VKERTPQETIEDIWPRVKRKHLYPEITTPKLGEVTGGEEPGTEDAVGLEIKAKQMTLNADFLVGLKGKMEEERAIEALLDHGVAHYTFCPWDFCTYVNLYLKPRRSWVIRTSKQVANHFIDVVSNTYCVKMRATDILNCIGT
jgi:hypothetical protein